MSTDKIMIIKVKHAPGLVKVEFDKNLSWFELPADDAVTFALALIKEAKKSGGLTSPIVIP